MRRNGAGSRWFGVACLAWGAASLSMAAEKLTAHQQLVKVREDWIAAGRPPAQTAVEVPEFGTDSETVVEVQAYAFQPSNTSDFVIDDGNGYRFFVSSSANPYFAAPVQIPSGVVIDFIKLSGREVHAGDFVLGLYDNLVNGDPNALIGSLTPATVNLYFNETAVLNYTYTQNVDHPLYFVIYVAYNPADGTVKFNNAQIYYHRIVSTAPASASFNDVATNHPFFQYIEALKASGITGGCQASPPLYCPDAPLTRGQMAVFLAKALGLHWPY